MINDSTLKELREKCERVVKLLRDSPYELIKHDSGDNSYELICRDALLAIYESNFTKIPDARRVAEFYSAANPKMVMELLNEIELLKKEGAQLSAGQCVHPEALAIEEGRDSVFCRKNDEIERLREQNKWLNGYKGMIDDEAERVFDKCVEVLNSSEYLEYKFYPRDKRYTKTSAQYLESHKDAILKGPI